MDTKSDIRSKETALSERIKAAGKLAVAFSGGTDSTYLLYKAHEILGENALAVTVVSQVMTEEDLAQAADFCKRNGIRHEMIRLDIFENELFGNNPPDRCYFCKKTDFRIIKETARSCGITEVADGSNTDDQGDYRPGMKALKELGIISPLKEAGLTKNEIRMLSKEAGLPTWDKPAAACLASRFAYGERITAEGIRRVAAAEKFIRNMGYRGIRVRVHGDLARIEVSASDIPSVAEESVRNKISSKLKELGFKYVTADLNGYRTGSMNEVLNTKEDSL